MAEVNTGLGWAAQEDWLVYSAAQLATVSDIGGPDFPEGLVPYSVSTNPVDVVAAGFDIGRKNSWNLDCFLVTLRDMPVVFGWVPAGAGYQCCVASPGDVTFTLYRAWGNSGEAGFGYGISGRTAYDSATNLSYLTFYVSGSGAPDPDIYYQTQFSSVQAMLAAVVITNATFSKTHNGYAVACIAKWKTQNNVTISTPILISSATDNTDMETDNTGISLAKLDILRQGMRFYMSFYDLTGDVSFNSGLHVLDLTAESPKTLEQVFAYIADLEHAAILVLDAPDPYEEESGQSGEEGGGGEDVEDDPVEEETLPLPSVAGHGFCTIYVPSSQELYQMASYLWGGSFDVSQVIKLFSNPMDSILGLSAVPVDLVGSSEQIYLGGVALPGVTMPKYTGRTSVKVDFGSVTVAKRWGSYLDYSPYTDFSIYLPFIGIKSIKADDIMGKTVNLTYAIDILSGGCVACLRPAGESVLYEWSGQCALQIPVTGRSYDNVFQSAMSVATAAFAAVAAPASAPVLSGAVASAAVQAVATKPHIERSGMVNGITGFLGQLRPYLIRTIPEACIPADQNKFIGYPAYINVDLATVKGYNEVDSIHMENVTATGAELDEIETILKGGVIF